MFMSKQRLWIVSELFPPEETSTGYIMGEIADTLAEKYDVAVITGPEVYDPSRKHTGTAGEPAKPYPVLRCESHTFSKT